MSEDPPVVLFYRWIVLDAPLKGFSLGRLLLRLHRSSQQRRAVTGLLPSMILPAIICGPQRGVLACFFAPNLAFQRVSLPPLPHLILQLAGVIVGDASHMPWTHLHLIQYKELPGPLMSPGPVAFSALWAVRQEAGGLGAWGQRNSLSTLL